MDYQKNTGVWKVNKTDMLVKKIKELRDESKRNGVWESLNEEIKDAVKTLINKLGVESIERKR